MAQPGGFFPNQYPTQSYIPAMWGFYNYIKSLNLNIGGDQCRVLLGRFAEAINAADQYEKQQRGFAEIQELYNLLLHTKNHYEFCQSLHWSQIGHRKQEFNYQIDQTAQALDRLLMQFGIAVGPQFHSTFAMIQKVRMDDERWLDGFIGRIDQAAPGPGSFGRAYQSQDTDSMDQMTDGVLQSQASVLAQDTELREEAEKQARELTKWIMGVTSQKLKPGLILGRRLVGEPKRIFITERNVIYTAEFVSGETVVLKMPNDQMQGQDSTTILKRFHAEVNLWHSLRYDHILPFYGIGMRQEADRNQVYGISPYLPNGDVRTYRQQHPLSVEESLQIAHDVALALRYLHERDAPIVHFNVRSRNVLINNEGRGVLGGFGLSQELLIPGSQAITDAASLPTDVTRFRAPEYQSDPGFSIKISADVWGWAMTTLELVGGEPPFCEIPNDFQAVTAMVGRVRPNRDAYPGIQQLYEPDALWQLLEDCWAHEESKRPVMGEVVLRMKGIRDRQNELGRQAPPVVSAPPRRRSQGATIEPSDGRANQATEQGRAPGR